MGFGFVVARFGLFLREIYATRGAGAIATHGISARAGTALVLLGVVLTVSSVFRYVHLLRRLERGDKLRKPSTLAIGLGSALAMAGAVVSVYLMLT
jgi:putative membrane protein